MKVNSRKVANLPEPDTSGPEFLRIPQVTARFGLSRSHIFQRIADRTFESVHVKAPGAKKGVRLIRTDSVRGYLNSFK